MTNTRQAVISNRIFLSGLNAFEREEIKGACTHTLTPLNFLPTDKPQIIRTYGLLPNNILAIPVGRQDLIPEDIEATDRRTQYEVEWPEAKGVTLRESQQYIYDLIDDSWIVNAPPAWGKTFTGLCIASKLRQKTLVIVHTAVLYDQWIEEAVKVFGERPGVIKAKEFKVSPWLTITTIQTLKSRLKDVPTLAEEFGTVIVDEAHHTPASTFSDCVGKLKARYKIGLTGTIGRRDGKECLFADYFGSKLYRPAPENAIAPRVLFIDTKMTLRLATDEGTGWAFAINRLQRDPKYMDLVSAVSAAMVSQGHKVLVVGDRVDFLQGLHELRPHRTTYIYGGSTKADKDAAKDGLLYGDLDELYGSTRIYNEGVSINSLSCLVLATPTNNPYLLEQLIGRITRVHPGKTTPVVVDLVMGGIGDAQYRARRDFYNSMSIPHRHVEWSP